jgi:NAD(P)-dependent dehydrogenase (short-subunit alcohol dehydrogenase family)
VSAETTHEQRAFEGGVAVVTGAGAGIGMGIARRCGAIGMTVIVTDIDAARAEAVAGEIKTAGGSAEAIQIDVSRPEALDALAEDVFARHGAVRLLVNNAGIETLGLTWEIPTARWEKTLDVNIHGVVHGVRAFVPHMLAAGKEAWIANLSSVGAFGQMPTQTAYIMSKHAIQSFSECLYLELELVKAPIHVSSVIPGMLKTSIFNAEAGQGEPDAAARDRATMASMMANYGMDLDEGCRRIVSGIAASDFWVSTQPDMTDDIVAARIAFFQQRGVPTLAEQARQLLQA